MINRSFDGKGGDQRRYAEEAVTSTDILDGFHDSVKHACGTANDDRWFARPRKRPYASGKKRQARTSTPKYMSKACKKKYYVYGQTDSD